MSDLHRHETASLGLRGSRIAGLGSEHARLLRLMLLAYTRWPGRSSQAAWPANTSLSARTGLDARQIERALAALRSAGLIRTRIGRRPDARRSIGRLIDLDLHAPVKAHAPEAHDVSNLWVVCRSIRQRPAAMITAMVGAYMLASDAAGGPIEETTALGCSMADWRRFVGHKENDSWTRRVRELEALGLIRREGRRVFVSPPRAWFSLAVDQAVVLHPEPEPEQIEEPEYVAAESPQPRRSHQHMGQIPMFDLPEPEPKADPADEVFAYLRERIIATKSDLGIKPVRGPRVLSPADRRRINQRIVEYGDGDESKGIEECKRVVDVDEADSRRRGEISGYWNATTPFRNAANFEQRLLRWREDRKHVVFGGRAPKGDMGFAVPASDELMAAITVGE